MIFSGDIWNYILTKFADYSSFQSISCCSKKFRFIFDTYQTKKLDNFNFTQEIKSSLFNHRFAIDFDKIRSNINIANDLISYFKYSHYSCECDNITNVIREFYLNNITSAKDFHKLKFENLGNIEKYMYLAQKDSFFEFEMFLL